MLSNVELPFTMTSKMGVELGEGTTARTNGRSSANQQNDIVEACETRDQGLPIRYFVQRRPTSSNFFHHSRSPTHCLPHHQQAFAMRPSAAIACSERARSAAACPGRGQSDCPDWTRRYLPTLPADNSASDRRTRTPSGSNAFSSFAPSSGSQP